MLKLNSIRCCLLMLSATCLTASMARGQTNEAAKEQRKEHVFSLENLKRTMSKEIEETLADTGIPSISIALLRKDQVIWAQAFGYSNVKLKTPATSSTIYGTGSCLKPITAMAVLQLVDQGKIGLDDPINKYLGNQPVADRSKDGKPVTVRHLLSHYSGLTVKFENLPLWERTPVKTLEQLASELKAEEDPGTRYRYSNSGYALAGLLVERVSGKTYEQYLVDNILQPLGIKLAGPIHPTPNMLEELSIPYRLMDRQPVPEARYRFDVYPAGDAYLTAPAMATILLSQLNQGKHKGIRLLSEASVKEMQTRQFGGNDGLDFGVRKFQGEKLIMHGGGVPGYSTKFILAVDSKVGVYVAANASGAHLPNQVLAQRAIDLLLGKKRGAGLVREINGLGIQPEVDPKSGDISIRNVFPRSPASRAGLSTGLIVQKVNGDDVAGKSMEQFLGMLKSKPGKPIELQLKGAPKTAPMTVKLSRGKFLVPS